VTEHLSPDEIADRMLADAGLDRPAGDSGAFNPSLLDWKFSPELEEIGTDDGEPELAESAPLSLDPPCGGVVPSGRERRMTS